MTQVYCVLNLGDELQRVVVNPRRKKQKRRGYQHGMPQFGKRRLSASVVLEIRALREKHGLSSRQLATMFGISETHARQICDYTVWSHLLPVGFRRSGS